MERRDLLKMILTATGVALVGNKAFAWDTTLTATDPKEAGFSQQDLNLLNEIAETIVPRTDTPGAKDAQCGPMMAIFVADCYTTIEQKTFREGMQLLNKQSQDTYNRPFMLLNSSEKFELLSVLDKTAKEANRQNGIYGAVTRKPNSRSPEDTSAVPHYFTLMKQLTLYSFFTSKVGQTKVLRHISIPGRYDGNLNYKPGDRAWA